MSNIQDYDVQIFENIKHINEYGQEFWYARELQSVLEYSQWRRFYEAIQRAITACEQSGNSSDLHFADVGKSSPMPNGGYRLIDDMMLSRYACYLIVMNGDPRKEVIALGQSYFAIKTRQQELIEGYDSLSEDQKSRPLQAAPPVLSGHNKTFVGFSNIWLRRMDLHH